MITKLDSDTVQRISSGQLLLDIPTTLKELIENAIDANSTQITLTIEDDGLTSLSCRDNGIGIRVDDRRYLGQRHATSKISRFEDIDSVRSYGFRGEAIASLCVIGNVFLTTRVDGEETARTYEFDRNGNIISEKVSAGQRGTTITVLNLFRGTPVRLAQLKKHRLSLGKVKSLVMTYALVREARFSLHVRGNKRLDWSVPASSDAMGVFTSVYGKDFMQQYTNLSWSSDGITIEGILPNSKDGSFKFGNTDVDTTVLDKPLQTRYIYIDSRPVSLTRNPAKQFLKLLRESYPASGNLQSSFTYLNLHCEADKVKYDCNMDPSKSEVIFEKFEVVCECFKRFLCEVYGMSSMRSPSPVPVDFFTPARGSSRLLSPPPSSPVHPARNLCVVEENSLEKTTPQKNLRQTRLDEYRSPHIPTDHMSQDTLSFVNERPSEGDAMTLRSIMGCGSGFHEIDLTRGIISSRQPRQTTNPEQNKLINAFRARFDTNGHPVTDAMQKQPSSRDISNFTKQLSTPRKATERVVKSPRTPGIRKPVRQESTPQYPPSSHTSIKFRSISESPGLEISLNPWTIAALNRNPKRARLEVNVPRQVSLHGIDDLFLQTAQPDMDLQTIVMVCEISMEEVAAGHVMLLSGVPPACDLMDILLQYYHDFEISTR